MIKSMTAFAEIQARAEPYAVRWELRSVNSRYLDLVLRLPENCRFLEPEIRQRVSARLKRGKVECVLRLEPLPDAEWTFELNRPLVTALVRALVGIEAQLPSSTPPSPVDVARWPGVLKEPEVDQETLGRAVVEALDGALEQLVAVRRREGERLAQFLRQRVQELRRWVAEARQRLPEALTGLREKLPAWRRSAPSQTGTAWNRNWSTWRRSWT